MAFDPERKKDGRDISDGADPSADEPEIDELSAGAEELREEVSLRAHTVRVGSVG
jgi:hypothetical protein